jgi:hypothetical protein
MTSYLTIPLPLAFDCDCLSVVGDNVCIVGACAPVWLAATPDILNMRGFL